MRDLQHFHRSCQSICDEPGLHEVLRVASEDHVELPALEQQHNARVVGAERLLPIGRPLHRD